MPLFYYINHVVAIYNLGDCGTLSKSSLEEVSVSVGA